MAYKLKQISSRQIFVFIAMFFFVNLKKGTAQNLALNRPVNVTSVYQNYVADNAVDGVVSDSSRWLNSPEAQPTISIELERQVRVGGVHIYSGYGSGSPIIDFKLQYNDKGVWQDIPSANISGNTAVAISITFDDTIEINSDAIRLLVSRTPGNYARVREITIWGYSPEGIPELGTGVTGYVKEITDADIPEIYINQSGYSIDKPKRFTAPTLADGTQFSIVNTENENEVLYTGKIYAHIGDFSDFNPTAKGVEYLVKAGGITSFPFGIGLWWTERVTYQSAINFMIDSRHYVGNYTKKASQSYGWRDDTHFGWELHTLVPQYLSHPQAYQNMPSQVYYVPPTNRSLWGDLIPYSESAPDVVKLIHWGADVIVTQGLTHENLKAQLAYFLYAWPWMKEWLPQQNYDRVKNFVFENWTKGTADRNYSHDESTNHNLLNLKTKIGTTKGGLPPGRSVQPNLLLYEVALRENWPEAENYFQAAYDQAAWMITDLDWESPLNTKGQRMSEFLTVTGLSHFVTNYPNRFPPGLKEKIKNWANVVIRRSDNMWDFRKFTDDAEWIPFDEAAATKWNEPGNVVGFPACLLAACQVIDDVGINERLIQLVYSHMDNCFGRNPVGRHFSYDSAREIEGVEVGWYSFYKGGIGQLANARFVLDGAPKYNHYPYAPEIGDVGWTEGWVTFNVAYNLSLAYMAHNDIEIGASVNGDFLDITVKVPHNFDYNIKEKLTVDVYDELNEVLKTFELEEETENSAYFKGTMPYNQLNNLTISYGYGYFKKKIEISNSLGLSTGENQTDITTKLYPNPVSGKMLNVDYKGGVIKSLKVLNVLGVEQECHFNGKTIDVKALKAGLYFIEINKSPAFKFIKL